MSGSRAIADPASGRDSIRWRDLLELARN